jgi:hypothetical protein
MSKFIRKSAVYPEWTQMDCPLNEGINSFDMTHKSGTNKTNKEYVRMTCKSTGGVSRNCRNIFDAGNELQQTASFTKSKKPNSIAKNYSEYVCDTDEVLSGLYFTHNPNKTSVEDELMNARCCKDERVNNCYWTPYKRMKESLSKKSSDNKSSDNKSSDNKSSDNKSLDKPLDKSSDNKSSNKSLDNKSSDDKSLDNKSLDKPLDKSLDKPLDKSLDKPLMNTTSMTSEDFTNIKCKKNELMQGLRFTHKQGKNGTSQRYVSAKCCNIEKTPTRDLGYNYKNNQIIGSNYNTVVGYNYRKGYYKTHFPERDYENDIVPFFDPLEPNNDSEAYLENYKIIDDVELVEDNKLVDDNKLMCNTTEIKEKFMMNDEDDEDDDNYYDSPTYYDYYTISSYILMGLFILIFIGAMFCLIKKLKK